MTLAIDRDVQLLANSKVNNEALPGEKVTLKKDLTH